MVNLHNSRAHNTTYPHDCLADKWRYLQDSHADSLYDRYFTICYPHDGSSKISYKLNANIALHVGNKVTGKSVMEKSHRFG